MYWLSVGCENAYSHTYVVSLYKYYIACALEESLLPRHLATHGGILCINRIWYSQGLNKLVSLIVCALSSKYC